MASSDVQLYEYHGPAVRVVALDLEVTDGDQVYGPDALDNVVGFSRLAASKASSKVVNERADAKEAVDGGAVGGSGEQTEDDR